MILKFFSELILTTTLLQIFPADISDAERLAFVSKTTPAPPSLYDAFSIPKTHFPVSKDTGPVKIKSNNLGVVTSAASAIVVDRKTKQILLQKNIDAPRSIGSITKLMTAYVFLKSNPDLQKVVTLEARDYRAGGIQHIPFNDAITMQDVLYASLVSSDNSATTALVRLSGMSESDFIAAMNEEAALIGMERTLFVDATGLSSKNESIVSDIVKLLDVVSDNPIIRDAAQHQTVSITTQSGITKTLKSTDELLGSFIHTAPYHIIAGKTGYLPEAGYCLGTVVSREGAGDIIVVVLGSDSNSHRFQDVKSLVVWAYQTFSWNL